MMMYVFQNSIILAPGLQNVAKALAQLEMLVVADTMMSETAKLANYFCQVPYILSVMI